MGWSYAKAAGETMQKFTAACILNSGSQNTWSEGNESYFFEISRKEHFDGAITGTIWRNLPGGTLCRRSGSFRIEADGAVTRAPKFLKDAAK